MNATQFLNTVIFPQAQVFKTIVSNIPIGREACVMLLAIAGQESSWRDRLQIGGPARGYWQFERFGGVDDVTRLTPRELRVMCQALNIPYLPSTIFEAIAWNDTLAFTMARLLLWMDPAPLPMVAAEQTAWEYYLRCWRPGAPDRARWSGVYREACAAVLEVGASPIIR